MKPNKLHLLMIMGLTLFAVFIAGCAVLAPVDCPEVAGTLPTTTPIAFVELVIAIQNIPAGTIITEEMVELRRWPLEAAPTRMINDLDDVVGMVALGDIFVEQPILSSMIDEP